MNTLLVLRLYGPCTLNDVCRRMKRARLIVRGKLLTLLDAGFAIKRPGHRFDVSELGREYVDTLLEERRRRRDRQAAEAAEQACGGNELDRWEC